MTINIRGLYKNIDEFESTMRNNDIDVAMIQENFLSQKNKHKIWGYNIISKVRETLKGGGVAIVVKNNLRWRLINLNMENNESNIEKVGIKLQIGGAYINLFSVYVPPKASLKDLEYLSCMNTKDAIIGGDFNAHNSMWSTLKENSRGRFVLDWIKNNDLEIVNNKKIPTYINNNKSSSTPDLLLFSKNSCFKIKDVEIMNEIGSDHLPIKTNFKINNGCFKKMDKVIILANTLNQQIYKNKIKQELNIIKTKRHDITYNSIIGIIYNAFRLNCRTKKIGNQKKGVPWWSKELDKEVKIRNRLWANNIKRPSILNNKDYTKQRNKVRNMIKVAKKNFWERFNGDKNIEDIHKVLRGAKFKSRRMFEVEINGNVVDDSVVASDFCKRLCKEQEHSKKNNNTVTKCYKRINKEEIDKLSNNISKEEIRNVIAKLKPRKAPGIDKITNIMITKGDEIMIDYLHFLFNKIFENSEFPKEWNYGIVIPIPKNKKKTLEITELRPICLLSTIFKCFERIILDRLRSCKQFNKQISDKQFGFKEKYSTCDNLFILQSRIHSARTSKRILIAIFVDVRAAYDSVDRAILRAIIKQIFGEQNKIEKFLTFFLSERFIKVQYNDKMSKTNEMKNGVPQGAGISPILFNLFIKDVTDMEEVYAYADDLMIMIEGNDSNIERKANITLEIIYKKLKNLNLDISFMKSKYMVFTRKKVEIKLKINNQKIDRVEKFKYLGVIFDERNTFKEHILELTSKTRKAMGNLKYLTNKLTGCRGRTLINIYKSYIQPKIEYAAIIWRNCSKQRIKYLESMQHRFLCWCLGVTFRTASKDVRMDCNIQKIEERVDLQIIKYIASNKFEFIYKNCIPVSEKKDNKKENILVNAREILKKYKIKFSEIMNDDWKRIKKEIIKKIIKNEKRKENRKTKEYIQTNTFINTHKTYSKRKADVSADELYSRRDECLFNQLKFGVLQLNKFKNRLNKNITNKCPNRNCNAEETRSHFLFYCNAYEHIRKNIFSNKRIKNSKYQGKIISDKKLKNNLIKYTKEALKVRNN